MFDRHIHAITSTYERLVSAPWTALMTVLVIGIALALPILSHHL